MAESNGADILDAPAGPPVSAQSDMPVIDPAANTVEPVDGEVKAADTQDTSAEKSEGEPTDGDKESGDADQTPPGVKAAMSRLRNNAKAAEQRAAQAEQQARDLAETLKRVTTEPTPEQKADPRPARETFTDPDAYDRALIDWSARRATEEATKATEARIVQEQRKSQAEGQIQTYQSRVETFRESHPDYDDLVLADDLHFSQEVTSAIVMAEDGPAVAYHLAQNPEVLDRISKLPPVQAVYEIGKISLRLQAPVTKPKPDPISPLGARSSRGTVDPADESMDSYGARRLAELREQRLN